VHAAELAAIFGAIGAVLAVILNVPQTWTSCARRETAGLSPTARWLAVLQSATWCAYALADGTSSQLYSSAVCGILHLAVLAALLLLCPAARQSAISLAVASLAWLVLVGWAATGGSVDVGLLAAGCGTAAVVPQVVRLLRGWDEDTSGISPLTCWLGIACSVAWLLHGALLGAEAVWVPSLIAAAASSLTLLLVQRPASAAGIRSRVAQTARVSSASLEQWWEHRQLDPRWVGVRMRRHTARCCRPRPAPSRGCPRVRRRGQTMTSWRFGG
jgi:uncharacterized protein with PQ loop repeat